jgi:acyl-CoA synthetase (AMP-forming)/AMP-acid ligase II
MEPDRDSPAVVLFTSGTTSRPKGVLHSLNTLTAGAQNLVRITGADERSVFFLASPLTSITGVTQMHAVADQHATLILEDRFDPERSLDRINDHGATLLGGAPVLAEQLLRAAAGRGRRIALRLIALGGAMLPMPLLELAMDGFGIDVARVYGSSEAPNSTGSLPHEDRARRLADDGAPMPGTEVRIGSAGHAQEGLLRGPAVFLGYVDPAHNADAFDDGWFRTGDAVEMHDGRLTVVGRLNDLVNRNGLKISPSEVDAALERLPGVVEHASFGVPDPDTGERLVVAVRPEDGAVLTLEGVCAHLRSVGTATRKLPEQLVVWDEALPRTASGKIVRSRLVMESSGKPTEYAPRLR